MTLTIQIFFLIIIIFVFVTLYNVSEELGRLILAGIVVKLIWLILCALNGIQ